MPAQPTLKTRLFRYRKNDAGSFSVEAVLVLPMMAWAILSAFSYFDGLRQNNINIKAVHTLSDMLSRETVPIDALYMEGMQDILDFLTGYRYDTALRVSVFEYDEDEEDYTLFWSQATNGTQPLSDETQELIEKRLPMTGDGDTIITVETWIDYKALYTYALEDTVLYQFAASRARYVPQLVFRYPDGTTSADDD